MCTRFIRIKDIWRYDYTSWNCCLQQSTLLLSLEFSIKIDRSIVCERWVLSHVFIKKNKVTKHLAERHIFRQWNQIDKEALAIVYGVTKHHQHLFYCAAIIAQLLIFSAKIKAFPRLILSLYLVCCIHSIIHSFNHSFIHSFISRMILL